MFQGFIEAIDGIDNGISQYPTEIKPRYRIRTDVSSRVATLNPAWNQSVDAKAVDVSRCLSAMRGSRTLTDCPLGAIRQSIFDGW